MQTTDRQERISWWRQATLAKAKVAVIGAGALGNEVLKNLALMGLGNLHVFDFDSIEESNLSRTVLFCSAQVGEAKANVAAKRTKELNVNPDAKVYGYHLDVVFEVGAGVLRRMDLVLGCLDNLEARLAIGRACYRFSIPYIDGGMRELGGRVQLHCTGYGGCMDCSIGSRERDAIQNRYSCFHVLRSLQAQGVMPTVQITSALIAALMCQEAVKYLHGKGLPFGSMLSWVGDYNDFDVLKIPRNPDCATCSSDPIGDILELPLSACDPAEQLLAQMGAGWRCVLPSPFILAICCGACGFEKQIGKPSFRCVDTELFCPACNRADIIHLSKIDVLDSNTDPTVLQKSLAQLGFPRLSAILATKDDRVAVVELTGDVREFGF